MRRIALFMTAVLLSSLCTGCSSSKIVEAGTLDKVAMELTDNGDALVKQKTIDLHRRFTMPDEVEIDVWVINARGTKSAKPRGTVILLHGMGEYKAKYLGVGKNLAKRGFDVVLIDLRCHGRSGGKYITCGAKEKQDVKTVLDTLIREKKVVPNPLYVFGVTFGGATAIQYAAIEPNVRGVVVIAPWKDTASKARRDVGLLMSEEDFQKVLAEAGKIADFNPQTTSAVKDAAKLTCPVYIIHGMFDWVVPLSDSQAILAVLPGPKKLKIITPGPEQMVVGIGWETWVPEQIEKVAKGRIRRKPAPKSKPAPKARTKARKKTRINPKPEKVDKE